MVGLKIPDGGLNQIRIQQRKNNNKKLVNTTHGKCIGDIFKNCDNMNDYALLLGNSSAASFNNELYDAIKVHCNIKHPLPRQIYVTHTLPTTVIVTTSRFLTTEVLIILVFICNNSSKKLDKNNNSAYFHHNNRNRCSAPLHQKSNLDKPMCYTLI